MPIPIPVVPPRLIVTSGLGFSAQLATPASFHDSDSSLNTFHPWYLTDGDLPAAPTFQIAAIGDAMWIGSNVTNKTEANMAFSASGSAGPWASAETVNNQLVFPAPIDISFSLSGTALDKAITVDLTTYGGTVEWGVWINVAVRVTSSAVSPSPGSSTFAVVKVSPPPTLADRRL